jgi:hypothetical protein
MPENNKDKNTSNTQVCAARSKMRRTVEKKEDGRLLIYYAFEPVVAAQEGNPSRDNKTCADKETRQP